MTHVSWISYVDSVRDDAPAVCGVCGASTVRPAGWTRDHNAGWFCPACVSDLLEAKP